MMLIAFEGIDGSGKTTQSGLLAKNLASRNISFHLTKEPTEGFWGKKIRDYIFLNNEKVDNQYLANLFFQDRLDHFNREIKPMLELGKIVITDRYYLSTACYQASTNNDPIQIKSFNEGSVYKPNICFLLDILETEALRRVNDRNKHGIEDLGIFEKIDKLRKVRTIYNSFTDSWIYKIDAARSSNEIADEILEVTLKKLEQSIV